ncbi:hypothetical protein COV16_00775 [Candidatus Woesearchaeota archaeon CG10_big_fil_rev_8_21_14_0_10_34_8]|nr:MAG: hypothetical protein COV16_00775 [Candidatus Woesearchaeota archaeon CG10_big_fil_rev_8_21_14_0_10_34_8]
MADDSGRNLGDLVLREQALLCTFLDKAADIPRAPPIIQERFDKLTDAVTKYVEKKRDLEELSPLNPLKWVGYLDLAVDTILRADKVPLYRHFVRPLGEIYQDVRAGHKPELRDVIEAAYNVPHPKQVPDPVSLRKSVVLFAYKRGWVEVPGETEDKQLAKVEEVLEYITTARRENWGKVKFNFGLDTMLPNLRGVNRTESDEVTRLLAENEYLKRQLAEKGKDGINASSLAAHAAVSASVAGLTHLVLNNSDDDVAAVKAELGQAQAAYEENLAVFANLAFGVYDRIGILLDTADTIRSSQPSQADGLYRLVIKAVDDLPQDLSVKTTNGEKSYTNENLDEYVTRAQSGLRIIEQGAGDVTDTLKEVVADPDGDSEAQERIKTLSAENAKWASVYNLLERRNIDLEQQTQGLASALYQRAVDAVDVADQLGESSQAKELYRSANTALAVLPDALFGVYTDAEMTAYRGRALAGVNGISSGRRRTPTRAPVQNTAELADVVHGPAGNSRYAPGQSLADLRRQLEANRLLKT